MTHGPLALALALLTTAAGCARGTCPPLSPSDVQGAALLPGGLMNVPYDGLPYHGDTRALDVYPHADEAVRPLALVLRGGAGTVGKRSSYVGQLIELFGDAGYVVAAADYRSSSVDAGVRDVTEALRLLTQCHADALHVDQYRTVIVAEDSAAPVALDVSATLLEKRLGRSAADPAAPAAIAILGGRFTGTGAAPAVPTRIVHGGGDSEVPPADAQAICDQAPDTCDVAIVEGASHRVENWWPSQWGYKDDLLAWAATHAGPVPPAARPGQSALRKRVVFDAATGLMLDAWAPDGAGPHPAVVVVHGGGWEAGDRVTYATPIIELAVRLGFAWVSIDYRLTPGVTNREQVADVKAALAWVRAHAADLRIDRSRLVLVGESASGQLVTHVAASEPDLRGVVSLYGVYDLEAMAGDPANPRSLARRLFGFTMLDDAARATLREFSPLRQASASLPPMLLVVGTEDRLAEQQRAYAAALRAAGARVEPWPPATRAIRGRVDIVEIPDAPHGVEAWNDEPSWRIWEVRVGDWLRFLI